MSSTSEQLAKLEHEVKLAQEDLASARMDLDDALAALARFERDHKAEVGRIKRARRAARDRGCPNCGRPAAAPSSNLCGACLTKRGLS